MKLGGKVAYAKAQHQDANFGNKAVGEIIVTTKGLRHSLGRNSGPMKEALLCDSSALHRALWGGRAEILPNTKPHVEATFGITTKVKIDGKVHSAQFIVHRHKSAKMNFLYHVRLHK